MNQGDIRNCRDFEERLTPYIDGEIDQEARVAADRHAAACPPCREHMESERGARDMLREHRAALRGSAPPELRSRCAGSRRTSHSRLHVPRWVPLSVAAALILALGAVFVIGMNDKVEALAAGLALDHVKCFKVSVPAGGTGPIDANAAAAAWEGKQGWPIVVPASQPAEGLRLIHVRRCLSTDGRVAHLMYLWHGAPLSVYVLPHSIGREEVLDSMGHETAVWSANGRTYAVLATGHPQDFDRIVAYVKTHAH